LRNLVLPWEADKRLAIVPDGRCPPLNSFPVQ
jgi:hypothetical protein